MLKKSYVQHQTEMQNHGKVGHFAVKCSSGKSEKVNSNAVEKAFLHL